MKVRNLKANHNKKPEDFDEQMAVLASVKLRNLKANHSRTATVPLILIAVLASMKVPNLKANHSSEKAFDGVAELY